MLLTRNTASVTKLNATTSLPNLLVTPRLSLKEQAYLSVVHTLEAPVPTHTVVPQSCWMNTVRSDATMMLYRPITWNSVLETSSWRSVLPGKLAGALDPCWLDDAHGSSPAPVPSPASDTHAGVSAYIGRSCAATSTHRSEHAAREAA